MNLMYKNSIATSRSLPNTLDLLNAMIYMPSETKRERDIRFSSHMPQIKRVIFNDPATIVLWADGTKTIVKCQRNKGDTFSKETGLAMAIAKRAYGNEGKFNEIFNRWLNDGICD